MSKIRSIVKLHNIFHEQAPSIGKKKKKNVKTVIILLLGSHILFQIFYFKNVGSQTKVAHCRLMLIKREVIC